MLHYRRTGDFARKLLKDAPDDRSRAYAYGYLSHIATDVIGHGYVNQIVGGPYRLHVQRHATVENFMDCWAFWNDYGGSVSHLIAEKLQLPDSLPAEIRDLLYQSFKETYEAIPHPTRLTGHDGFFTPRQIEEAYEAFYLVVMAENSIRSTTVPNCSSRAQLILENALLRQQLIIYQRETKRPKITGVFRS